MLLFRMKENTRFYQWHTASGWQNKIEGLEKKRMFFVYLPVNCLPGMELQDLESLHISRILKLTGCNQFWGVLVQWHKQGMETNFKSTSIPRSVAASSVTGPKFRVNMKLQLCTKSRRHTTTMFLVVSRKKFALLPTRIIECSQAACPCGITQGRDRYTAVFLKFDPHKGLRTVG
jgi:hypothetical protein